jgi:hypothetical protein
VNLENEYKHIVHNGRRCHGRIIVLMQPVPIATNVVSSNPVDGAVYSIQYIRNNSTVFEKNVEVDFFFLRNNIIF